MKSLPAGASWYFAAPTRRATVELTPSRPTTRAPATRLIGLHPRDAAAVFHQVRHRRLDANLGTRRRGGLEEQGVERHLGPSIGAPTSSHDAVDLDTSIVEGDGAALDRGSDLQERLHQTQPVEDLDARRLHAVSRRCRLGTRGRRRRTRPARASSVARGRRRTGRPRSPRLQPLRHHASFVGELRARGRVPRAHPSPGDGPPRRHTVRST